MDDKLYKSKSKKQKEHCDQNYDYKVQKRVEEMERDFHQDKDRKVNDEAWKKHMEMHPERYGAVEIKSPKKKK